MPAAIDSKEKAQITAVRVAGLDHVVLVVADLARAVDFYEGVLGCRVERSLEKPKLVQLRAGASLIDLVPGALAGKAAATTEAAGTRRNMDHFALRLEGFDPAVLGAHLKRHGVVFGEVMERYGAEGYGPSIYIEDPDGNVVELKGPAQRKLEVASGS